MTQEAQHIGDKCGRFRVELPVDVEIAALAVRQHGVVGLSQLRELGLSARAVQRRATCGRLHRIRRGVYAVGHSKLTGYVHWMAAVLACGPKAVLSHRTAAGLWGLRPDNRRKSDTSSPSPSATPRQATEVHRSVTLSAADMATMDGIPCTTVAGTLVDLGDMDDRRGVERAVEQAEVLRLFDLSEVKQAIERAGPCLDDASGWHADQDRLLWRSERLAVEMDGGPFIALGNPGSATREGTSCCGSWASSPSALPTGRSRRSRGGSGHASAS
jgi:predicted transcriptional regulator of viral defense system